MKLEHRFTVPAPVPDVWAALLDPEKVAPCMPGATLTGVDGQKFTGTVKVKLGPVTLLYKGTGEFTSVDERVHAAVLKASGKDARGNGTASATVSVALTSTEGAPGTEVYVVTDMNITGRPAQLGRGLINDVSGRIIGEFAECLATRLAPAEAEQVTTAETAPPARPRLHAVPDEPIDLLDTAGVPVLKRVLPVVAGLLVLVLLVRRLRGRHR
ncbi:carbon monoxide dehydrogenase subunit G [Saccharothrix ecbatanensis]|uniref:Carbon monoxide dehydrogenase subunit G n=1 Tax=Saccharothrix ecbatanensis TaxID=1105145 RepID=A0A7W9M4N8_9PSEU|nr:SRPBCC family protein [Saccharothrix ecbatanensis]MBB5807311.1 carbon monoxide dehydrogenase subunit G [Saccharothrix ecbatanensis]